MSGGCCPGERIIAAALPSSDDTWMINHATAPALELSAGNLTGLLGGVKARRIAR